MPPKGDRWFWEFGCFWLQDSKGQNRLLTGITVEVEVGVRERVGVAVGWRRVTATRGEGERIWHRCGRGQKARNPERFSDP